MPLRDRLRRALERPGAPRLILAFGVLLCAPSLGNGLNLDDVLHAARLGEGDGSPWRLFDLFGGPAPLVAVGDAPWWRHEAMQLALMRPLASLSHLGDHCLFGGRPIWMHLHSLAWYGLLLAVAGRVYARLLPARWTVALALLAYAVAHTHGMVVGWLAARSGLIGAVGALLCLWAHDRWRRDGWRPGAWLGALALLAALLANEGAVGICGYLAAYALCLDRGRPRDRLRSLLPAALTVLAWRACYVAAGFGAAHSGFYFDPGADPLAYLVRALEHGVILVCSQTFLSVGELLGMAPGLYRPGALAAAAVLAALGLLFRAELRRCATLRFWAAGTLLSALPLGSTLPTDRQLLLVGFGVFGGAAQLCFTVGGAPTARPGLRWLAWPWFVLHLVFAPLLLPLRALAPAQIHGLAERAMDRYMPPSAPGRVVLLRVPTDLLMLYGRAQRRLQGRPAPDELRYLYAGLGALTITRVDDRTLELRPELGWLYAPLDRLYRDERARFTPGQRVHAGTMTAEVREVTADGRPRVVRLGFDRALEHPDFAWYSWEAGGPTPYALPAIGATHTMPAMQNPMLAP